MTREVYHAIKPAFYIGCFIAGIALWWFLTRLRPGITILERLALLLPAIVAGTSALFVPWFFVVTRFVSVRDEGIQVGLEFILIIGPGAVAAAIGGLPFRKVRTLALLLTSAYLASAALLLLIG